jgi:hypothetical protein
MTPGSSSQDAPWVRQTFNHQMRDLVVSPRQAFARELEPSSFNNFLEEPPACIAAHSTPYDIESSVRSSLNLARGGLDGVAAVVLDELEAGRGFRHVNQFENLSQI